MPSGAKKRKAAKKKKEKEATINSATHSKGIDDLKTQDERDSDGGEVSSPASQDHHHQFIEGDEEEERDTSSVRSFVSESKSMEGVPNDGEGAQKVALEDEGVVEINRELKSEDASESKSVSIEYVESAAKKSHSGGSSGDDGSSSSSSSDDESQVTRKSSLVVESEKSKEATYNSGLDDAPLDDSDKLVDFLSEEVTGVMENPPVGEVYNSVVDIATVVDSVEPLVSLPEEVIKPVVCLPEEEVICLTGSAPLENTLTSDVVELGKKENEDKFLPPLDENARVSEVVMDSASKKTEDKVFPLSDENAGASSSAMGFATKESEDKLLQSSEAPAVEFSNGAEHIKNSEIPECSENQPLVASAPQRVQTTSWKSCCGLFDVLTGSNR